MMYYSEAPSTATMGFIPGHFDIDHSFELMDNISYGKKHC